MTTLQPIEIDLSANPNPLPVDATGLAMWLGIKAKVLWWLVLFRHKHYKEFKIPKPNGSFRVLHEPAPELKFVQKMIVHRILSKFPSPEHIGAYEEGKGVKYTTSRHAGDAVILELDIKDFFGSTTRRYVRELFYAQGWPKESSRLLADLLTYPEHKTLSVVPQGSPSSPMLCNIIANERFDGKIIEFLKTVDSGWKYSRYSDNLIVSHPVNRGKTEIDHILQSVKDLVKAGGYYVHPKKVKVMRSTNPVRPQRLLGLTVNTKPNISLQKYKILRAQVHRAFTEGFDKVTGLPKSVTGAESAITHIGGLISYYSYINPSNKMQKLKEKFDLAVKGHELKKSV